MSIKILFVFLCTAVGTATGFAVLLSYRRNFEYVEGVCGIISELKRNIAYRRDGVVSVLGSMSFKSKQLAKNVDEYISFASGKTDRIELGKNFLPNEIYEKTCALFGSLGRSDGEAQIDELNMFEQSFMTLKSSAESKCKKYGPVAVKLGFLIGLGVGILVL